MKRQPVAGQEGECNERTIQPKLAYFCADGLTGHRNHGPDA